MSTMAEMAAKGISRVRAPRWAEGIYMRIDIIDGKHGPWLHLYDRITQGVLDAPTPQDILFDTFDPTYILWLPYEGEKDEADDHE